MNGLKHLFKVIATNLRGKGFVMDIIEQFPFGHKLKDHNCNWDLLVIRFNPYSIFLEFDQFDNVRVLELSVSIDFIPDSFLSHLILFLVCLVIYFNCIHLAIRTTRKLHDT